MARVLVVDDEPDIRELITLRLRAAGHTVVAASSPQAALAVVGEQGNPDLAVLDVDMPGMDGFALLRLLRTRQSDLPVIFVTARPGAEVLVRATGGVYLAKPFTGAALRTAVDRAVSLGMTGLEH